jgi:hypothetical protein
MFQENSNYQVVKDEFPIVGNKIAVFWGQPEFAKLIDELTQNDGLKPRVGFPGEIMMALHALDALHDIEFPHLSKKSSGIWQL